ncbi:hypothetical protein BBJ28_00025266, partial [Nothophytophthora sp. Chile5]
MALPTSSTPGHDDSLALSRKLTRNRLTLQQQLEVCKHAKIVRAKGPCTNIALAAWASREFKLKSPLSRDAVRKILEREAKLTAVSTPQLARKTILAELHRAADERIMSVFNQMDGVVESITGDVIRAISVHVNPEDGPSALKLSNGWLYRLQKRHGISLKRKHGEAASVDENEVPKGRAKMRRLTLPYARSDIYNMDETSFFFRSDVKTTLSTKKKVSGKKDPKNRITLALAVNADGTDKLPSLYIGSAAVPRPLRGHNNQDVFEEEAVGGSSDEVAVMQVSDTMALVPARSAAMEIVPEVERNLANVAEPFIAQMQTLAGEHVVLKNQQEGVSQEQHAALVAVQGYAESGMKELSIQQLAIAERFQEGLRATQFAVQEQLQHMEKLQVESRAQIEGAVGEKLAQTLVEVRRASQSALAAHADGASQLEKQMHTKMEAGFEELIAHLGQLVKEQLSEVNNGGYHSQLVEQLVNEAASAVETRIGKSLEGGVKRIMTEQLAGYFEAGVSEKTTQLVHQ